MLAKKTQFNGYFESLKKSTQKIVKECIIQAAEDRSGPEGYKTNEECLSDIECRSRDGFIAAGHNKGGLLYRNFTDLMDYWGGGHTPKHDKVANDIQKQIDYNFELIRDQVYEEYESLCLELNIAKEDCTYHSIDQFIETSENNTEEQKTQLKKMLREIEDLEGQYLSGNDNSIMHELRFMYHGCENGIHSASVSAVVNTEGPYHRSSISWARDVFCEGGKEVEITWRTDNGLKTKLIKAFKVVSKETF